MSSRLRLGAILLAVLLVDASSPEVAATPSPAARWLQGYLRIDTTNPPGNEHLAAGYLAGLLTAEGIAHELLVHPSGRPSLLAHLPATTPEPERGTLLLLHHMDVVAAEGPAWRFPPFSGTLAEGRVWGRGALDAKSLGIAQLASFVALARSAAPRHRPVTLLAVPDEEAGGGAGTRFVLERYAPRLGPVAAVLNEGGSNRLVNGNLLWWGVEVAQKRPLWLSATAEGRGGHAAGFHPASPLHTLIGGLDRLLDLPPRWHVSPPVAEYLGALAPLHNDRWRRIFAEVETFVTEEGPEFGMLPGMANLFLDTVQVTRIEAAEQINVVASTARASIDCRLLPDTDAQAFLARIEEALGPEIAVEVLLGSPPAPSSPVGNAAWDAIAAGFRGAPVVPVFSSGFTDSRYFRERGIPAYGISPFLLEVDELRGIHGEDESLPVTALDAGISRLGDILDHWVGTD